MTEIRLEPEVLPLWDRRVPSLWHGSWKAELKNMYKRRLGGETLESIARSYGLSKQRMAQIIMRINNILIEQLGKDYREKPPAPPEPPKMSRSEAGSLGGSRNTTAQHRARIKNLEIRISNLRKLKAVK